MFEIDKIKKDFEIVLIEFLSLVKLKEKNIFIIGCSTSEIQGKNIGTLSSPEIANVLLDIIIPMIRKNKIFLYFIYFKQLLHS